MITVNIIRKKKRNVNKKKLRKRFFPKVEVSSIKNEDKISIVKSSIYYETDLLKNTKIAVSVRVGEKGNY